MWVFTLIQGSSSERGCSLLCSVWCCQRRGLYFRVPFALLFRDPLLTGYNSLVYCVCYWYVGYHHHYRSRRVAIMELGLLLTRLISHIKKSLHWRNGGNAIPQHDCAEAKDSNSSTGLTLFWACNPFKGNSNNWHVSQEEAGWIIRKRRHGNENDIMIYYYYYYYYYSAQL